MNLIARILTVGLILVGFGASAQITINTNFEVNSNQPIDTRDTLTTLADTANVDWPYGGLQAYAVDVDEFWYYNGSFWKQIESATDTALINTLISDSLATIVVEDFDTALVNQLISDSLVNIIMVTGTDTARWDTAYNRQIESLNITGTTTKTVEITLANGETISDTFNDLSGAGGDGNDFLDGASFNSSSGVITLTVTNQPDVTVDIDGRYVGSAVLADTASAIRDDFPDVSGFIDTELDPQWTSDSSNYAAKSLVADTAAAIRADFPDVSGFIDTELDPVWISDSSNYAAKSLVADTAAAIRADFPTNFDDADADPNNENQTVSAGWGVDVTNVGQDYEVEVDSAEVATLHALQDTASAIRADFPNGASVDIQAGYAITVDENAGTYTISLDSTFIADTLWCFTLSQTFESIDDSTFTLSNALDSCAEYQIYLNGAKQYEPTDYTIAGQNVTFTWDVTGSRVEAVCDGCPGLIGSGGGGGSGLSSVSSDATLSGDGTSGDPLGADTSILATQTDIANFIDTELDPQWTSDSSNYAAKSLVADTAAAIRADFPDVSGFIDTEIDPQWTSDSSNYAAKSLVADTAAAIRADFPDVSGFIDTELDPQWTSDSSNYAAKALVADTAAAIRADFPDVSGFIDTEIDPQWTSDSSNYAAKSLVADTAAAIRADFPTDFDDADADAANEGVLGVSGSGSVSRTITSNTTGANGVSIQAGLLLDLSGSANSNGGTITLDVDLTELSTSTVFTTSDELIWLDGNQGRKGTFSEMISDLSLIQRTELADTAAAIRADFPSGSGSTAWGDLTGIPALIDLDSTDNVEWGDTTTLIATQDDIANFITSPDDADADAANEGILGVSASGSDAILNSNTTGANGVTFQDGVGLDIWENANSNGGSIRYDLDFSEFSTSTVFTTNDQLVWLDALQERRGTFSEMIADLSLIQRTELADTASAIRADFPSGGSTAWGDLTGVPAGFADDTDDVDDADADAANEGILGVSASGSDAILNSNTTGANGVTFQDGAGLDILTITGSNGGDIRFFLDFNEFPTSNLLGSNDELIWLDGGLERKCTFANMVGDLTLIARSELADTSAAIRADFPTGGSTAWADLTGVPAGFADDTDDVDDADADADNEGILGVSASGDDATVTSNTTGANGVTFQDGTGLDIVESGSSNGGSIRYDLDLSEFSTSTVFTTSDQLVWLDALQERRGTFSEMIADLSLIQRTELADTAAAIRADFPATGAFEPAYLSRSNFNGYTEEVGGLPVHTQFNFEAESKGFTTTDSTFRPDQTGMYSVHYEIQFSFKDATGSTSDYLETRLAIDGTVYSAAMRRAYRDLTGSTSRWHYISGSYLLDINNTTSDIEVLLVSNKTQDIEVERAQITIQRIDE